MEIFKADHIEHAANLNEAINILTITKPDLLIISKEGEQIPAHRSFLSLLSPHLSQIFSGIPSWINTSIHVPDISADAINNFLKLVYSCVSNGSDIDGILSKDVNLVHDVAFLLGTDIQFQGITQSLQKDDSLKETSSVGYEEVNISKDDKNITYEEAQDITYSVNDYDKIIVTVEETDCNYLCPDVNDNVSKENADSTMTYHEMPDSGIDENSINEKTKAMSENLTESCQICLETFVNTDLKDVLEHYFVHLEASLEESCGYLISKDGKCKVCLEYVTSELGERTVGLRHLGIGHDKLSIILDKNGIILPEEKFLSVQKSNEKAFSCQSSEIVISENSGLDSYLPLNLLDNAKRNADKITKNENFEKYYPLFVEHKKDNIPSSEYLKCYTTMKSDIPSHEPLEITTMDIVVPTQKQVNGESINRSNEKRKRHLSNEQEIYECLRSDLDDKRPKLEEDGKTAQNPTRALLIAKNLIDPIVDDLIHSIIENNITEATKKIMANEEMDDAISQTEINGQLDTENAGENDTKQINEEINPNSLTTYTKTEINRFPHAISLHILENDYNLIYIVGDGHCLFRSLAHGMGYTPEMNMHLQIREEIASEGLRRINFYYKLSNYYLKKANSLPAFEAYLKKILYGGSTWGCNIDLAIASKLYEMDIYKLCYNATSNKAYYNVFSAFDGELRAERFIIIHFDDSKKGGEHYSALEKIGGNVRPELQVTDSVQSWVEMPDGTGKWSRFGQITKVVQPVFKVSVDISDDSDSETAETEDETDDEDIETEDEEMEMEDEETEDEVHDEANMENEKGNIQDEYKIERDSHEDEAEIEEENKEEENTKEEENYLWQDEEEEDIADIRDDNEQQLLEDNNIINDLNDIERTRNCDVGDTKQDTEEDFHELYEKGKLDENNDSIVSDEVENDDDLNNELVESDLEDSGIQQGENGFQILIDDVISEVNGSDFKSELNYDGHHIDDDNIVNKLDLDEDIDDEEGFIIWDVKQTFLAGQEENITEDDNTDLIIKLDHKNNSNNILNNPFDDPLVNEIDIDLTDILNEEISETSVGIGYNDENCKVEDNTHTHAPDSGYMKPLETADNSKFQGIKDTDEVVINMHCSTKDTEKIIQDEEKNCLMVQDENIPEDKNYIINNIKYSYENCFDLTSDDGYENGDDTFQKAELITEENCQDEDFLENNVELIKSSTDFEKDVQNGETFEDTEEDNVLTEENSFDLTDDEGYVIDDIATYQKDDGYRRHDEEENWDNLLENNVDLTKDDEEVDYDNGEFQTMEDENPVDDAQGNDADFLENYKDWNEEEENNVVSSFDLTIEEEFDGSKEKNMDIEEFPVDEHYEDESDRSDEILENTFDLTVDDDIDSGHLENEIKISDNAKVDYGKQHGRLYKEFIGPKIKLKIDTFEKLVKVFISTPNLSSPDIAKVSQSLNVNVKDVRWAFLKLKHRFLMKNSSGIEDCSNILDRVQKIRDANFKRDFFTF